MPESRDRLIRPVDIAALFARRRTEILGIYRDQPELDLALTPIRRPITANRAVTTGASPVGRGRGGFGPSRSRNTYGTLARNRGNTPIRRGNGRGSILPSWYPRTPLRDITAVVRAIERRRERLGVSGAQEIESPVPHAYGAGDSSEPSPVDALLEHSKTIMSPIPSLEAKGCPSTVGKVPKILLRITEQAKGDSEFLTPQKKLLNSIDTVEKEVMEELRKLSRTASAKRAERDRKVRTLMSFR